MRGSELDPADLRYAGATTAHSVVIFSQPVKERGDRQMADHLLTAIMVLFFIMYPAVSFKLAAMFQCITLEGWSDI